jgi:outer membrane protein assembly factor BamB
LSWLRGEVNKLNTKKIILILLAVLGVLTLSACTGGRTVSNNWHGLTADAERAYLSSGSLVYGVDLKTGSQSWSYPPKADAKLLFYASPVLTQDGQLLVGSAGTTHSFVSLDPATGKENWNEVLGQGTWLASPLVFDNVIYAPNTDGFLYILDMNGKETTDPIELGGALWSAPSTDGTYLYITSLDHHLHIIDIASKKQVASVNLGGAAPSSPVVANDGVYVGSFASTVEFVKPDGGREVVAKAANWVWGTPVVGGESLYFADLNGKVYSFNLASGKQNWDAVQPGGPVVASPLVVGDQLYVATENGILFKLDNTGNTVWQKPVGGQFYTTPVLSGGLILVAPYQADFALAAYDAQSKQAWTFTPAK